MSVLEGGQDGSHDKLDYKKRGEPRSWVTDPQHEGAVSRYLPQGDWRRWWSSDGKTQMGTKEVAVGRDRGSKRAGIESGRSWMRKGLSCELSSAGPASRSRD